MVLGDQLMTVGGGDVACGCHFGKGGAGSWGDYLKVFRRRPMCDTSDLAFTEWLCGSHSRGPCHSYHITTYSCGRVWLLEKVKQN